MNERTNNGQDDIRTSIEPEKCCLGFKMTTFNSLHELDTPETTEPRLLFARATRYWVNVICGGWGWDLRGSSACRDEY
jgi:hypothetical protein